MKEDTRLKKIVQKGEKSIYIEQNTGNIHIHSPKGIEIIKPENLEAFRVEMGENFERILQAIQNNQNHNSIPHRLTNNPLSPDTFLGREKDLKEIRKRFLEDEGFLLLVNGDGGIGKSTLAAVYYEKFADQYPHIAWLVNEMGIEATLLQLAPALGLEFNDAIALEERWPLLLQKMAGLPKPCLLVLDNTNKPKDLQAYYLALRSLPNFHILLTSRISSFENAPTFKIEGLKEKDAMVLFTKHYPQHKKEDNPLLKEIIKAVNQNTLIIELMAKNLAANNSFNEKYSLQQLLTDLQKSLLSLSHSKPVQTSYQVKSTQGLQQATVEEIVAAMYQLENLTEAEKQLASVFALLPLEAIPYKILNFLLSNELKEDALKTLIYRGWIDHDTNAQTLKVNQVVQEVVSAKQQVRLKEDGKVLIDNIIQYLFDENNLHKNQIYFTRMLVRYAENIALSLEKQASTNYLSLLNAIGNFYTNSGDVLSALAHYTLFNTAARLLCTEQPANMDFKNGLAISYSKLGETHAALGNLDKALEFYQKQSGLFLELYQDSPKQVSFKNGLAISYSKLGETHAALGNLDKALEFYQKDVELTKELYQDSPKQVSFKNGLAISYSKLGETHAALGNLDKALEFYQKQSGLFLELYQDSPKQVSFKNGLAISYSKLGETHAALGNLDKALEFYQKDVELTKELYQEYPKQVSFKNGLAISYSKLGETHAALGNLDKALEFYQKRSKLGKELYQEYPKQVSFKNGLAISYSKLGETHAALGNLDKALEFYQKRSKLGKELYQEYPKQVSFKNGLAISYSKLGETHAALGNLDKALEFFQKRSKLGKELYQEYPKQVSFKNGLAISYEKLGETHAALGNLDKALEFYQKQSGLFLELYQEYPKQVSFKNGLAISLAKLGVFFTTHQPNAQKAQTYFKEAKELWEALVAEAPSAVEYQRNLDLVNNKLNNLS